MSLGLCVKCGREWNGTSACHCAGCHEHFGSLAAFDRHRVGFECLPVERFSELVGKKNPHPRLVVSERPTGNLWVTALRDAENALSDDGEGSE